MSNQKNKKEEKLRERLKLFKSIRDNIVFREFITESGEEERIINQKYSKFLREIEHEFYAKIINFSFNCDLHPYISVIINPKGYEDILLNLYKEYEVISETISIKDFDYLLRKFLVENRDKELSTESTTSFFIEINKLPIKKYKAVSLIFGVSFLEKQIELGNFKITKTNLEEIKDRYGSYTSESINYCYIKKQNFLSTEDVDKSFYVIEYEKLELKKIDKFNSDFTKYTSKIFNKYFDDITKFLYYMNGERGKLSLKREFEDHSSKGFLHIYNVEDDKFAGGSSHIKGGTPLYLDGNFSIFKNKINDIKLFNLIDKQKSDLDLHIYNAIIWAGKSLMNEDLEESFAQLFIALESLIPEKKDMDDWMAFLLGENYEDRIRIKEVIATSHIIRSRIVHQNIQSISVSEYQYYDLFHILKRAIHKMYTNDAVKTFEDMRTEIKKIKYS